MIKYMIFLCTILATPAMAIEGIMLQAPQNMLSPGQKSQLLNLLVNHPEKLALDAQLFVVTSHDHYLNITLIEAIVDRIIDSMRNLDIESLPLRKLLFSQQGKQQFLANVFNQFPSYEQYQLIKKNYASEIFEPISFIQECDCFARQRHNYRQEFEKRALAFIQEQYPDRSKQLTVTEFASGELFELLVLCTKLVNMGYKNLRINCIDLKYKNIIDLYPIKNNTIFLQQFYPWKPETLTKLQTLLLRTIAEKRPPEWEAEAAQVWEQNFNFTVYRTHQACVQFVQWFNNSNPTIEVIVYDDAQKYIDDCAQNPALKSDLICALDYFADDGNYNRWDRLRQDALKLTGRAYSVYDKIERKRVFFSIGTTDSVKHYLFSDDRLKRVKEIPAHYRQVEGAHENVKIPAIPEIVPLSELLVTFYAELRLI